MRRPSNTTQFLRVMRCFHLMKTGKYFPGDGSNEELWNCKRPTRTVGGHHACRFRRRIKVDVLAREHRAIGTAISRLGRLRAVLRFAVGVLVIDDGTGRACCCCRNVRYAALSRPPEEKSPDPRRRYGREDQDRANAAVHGRALTTSLP